MQGLPDAQTPENVLTLIDTLQTQLLKSAERLGQVETQCADQTGGRSQNTTVNITVVTTQYSSQSNTHVCTLLRWPKCL